VNENEICSDQAVMSVADAELLSRFLLPPQTVFFFTNRVSNSCERN